MIDWENLIVQIVMLGIFGVVYAYIGGKIGFKAGSGTLKKEGFDLIGIDLKRWKKLSKEDKRKLLIEQVAKALQETVDLLKTDKQVTKISEAAIKQVTEMPEFQEAKAFLEKVKKVLENVTEELDVEAKAQREKRKGQRKT